MNVAPRRRRPPRWVDPVRALQAYSWRQAAGRLLLRRLRGGAHQHEGFAGCVPLAPPHTFIVATCEWGPRPHALSFILDP